tara:strand:+ start:550 stop:930 length:381 start_codon:yes stop_codon:yes gene_type:complete
MENIIRPNCGPTALAHLSSRTVEEVENKFREVFNKSANWKGRSNTSELCKIGRHFGLNLIGGRVDRGGSLKKFIEWYSKPNTDYLIRVGNHFVAWVDGKIKDNHSTDRINELARKRVSHIYEVKEG